MPSISSNEIVVEFDVVLSEKIGRSGIITSSPIEDNSTVADHFSKSPNTLAISGVCTNDAANKIANLNALYVNGTLCKYIGRNGVSNVVITKFDTDHGAIVDKAFSFTMTMVVVKISSTKEFTYSTGTTKAQSSAQINKQTNIGTNQPATRATDSVTTASANSRATTLTQSW